MRLLKNSAHGDSANHARELQGSRCHRALADGHRNGFAGIPFAMEHPLHPLFAGHESGFFGRQINTSAVPKPQMPGVIGNTVNAYPLAHVVKEDVAGLYDCFGQTYVATRTLPSHPALEFPSTIN